MLDELLATVRAAATSRSFAAARQALGWFRVELDKHMRVEEQLIFPLLEAVTGLDAGPTRFRRAEHHLINAILDRIGTSLARDRDIDEDVTRLLALLAAHDRREAQMVHPLIRRVTAGGPPAPVFEGARRMLEAPLSGDSVPEPRL